MSLENQQKFFETYTDQNNMEIYHLYKDDGISAKSMKKRGDFNKMVSDAKMGRFTVILVKDISRFARNTYDFLGVTRELKSLHIKVAFITANMTTYDSELMLTMLAAVAQEESSNLSKRVKFAKQQSAKEGRVPSMVYGYDKVHKDRFHLTINEAEAKVVQRIFDLYVNEQMSSYQIARRLSEALIPTKKGGQYKWSQTVVCNILKNPLYIGQVCNGKSEIADYLSEERVRFAESEWIRVDRPDFRIVSDELFHSAKVLRERRSNAFGQFEDDGKTKRNRPSVRYPLSNLLKCANDTYSFRRRVRSYQPSGYQYTYWSCSKRDSGVGVCNNTIKIDEGQMQRIIMDFLLQLFSSQSVMRDKCREKMNNDLHCRCQSEYRADDLFVEQKKLQAQRDKLLDLYLEEGLDKRALKTKVLPIENRLKEIAAMLKVYHAQDNLTLTIETCLAELLETMNDHPENLMDNAFLKSIFETFLVYPDGKVAAYLKLDTDKGETVEIPFCKVADDYVATVPKYMPGI